MTNIFAPHFQNEDKARERLEALRWPDGPFCPHCGSFKATRLVGKKHRKGLVQCNEGECRQQFTVTVGTVFERSKVPLHKWLFVNHLMCASKKGVSAHQVHRMIGVTYKTAWFMCHRIREAMKQDSGPMGGDPSNVIEADETFVGGRGKNRAYAKPAPKKIVFTLVERGGHARSFHIANIHHGIMRPLLFKNVDRLSTLMTDEGSSYRDVGTHYWQHKKVNHGLSEYGRRDETGHWHTNTVENFFSIFKRGIIGVFHHVSEAHLSRYAAEFDFRYNTKGDTDAERADQSLRGIYGKRLTYRRPHALAA
jgi:transposase-like protein